MAQVDEKERKMRGMSAASSAFSAIAELIHSRPARVELSASKQNPSPLPVTDKDTYKDHEVKVIDRWIGPNGIFRGFRIIVILTVFLFFVFFQINSLISEIPKVVERKVSEKIVSESLSARGGLGAAMLVSSRDGAIGSVHKEPFVAPPAVEVNKPTNHDSEDTVKRLRDEVEELKAKLGKYRPKAGADVVPPPVGAAEDAHSNKKMVSDRFGHSLEDESIADILSDKARADEVFDSAVLNKLSAKLLSEGIADKASGTHHLGEVVDEVTSAELIGGRHAINDTMWDSVLGDKTGLDELLEKLHGEHGLFDDVMSDHAHHANEGNVADKILSGKTFSDSVNIPLPSFVGKEVVGGVEAENIGSPSKFISEIGEVMPQPMVNRASPLGQVRDSEPVRQLRERPAIGSVNHFRFELGNV